MRIFQNAKNGRILCRNNFFFGSGTDCTMLHPSYFFSNSSFFPLACHHEQDCGDADGCACKDVGVHRFRKHQYPNQIARRKTCQRPFVGSEIHNSFSKRGCFCYIVDAVKTCLMPDCKLLKINLFYFYLTGC